MTQKVEVCTNKIMTAVENVKGDPAKGYHNVAGICNAPLTVRLSDNFKHCPRCYKEPAVGNVKPRTTNSAGIQLTARELQECGVSEDPSLKAVTPVEGVKEVALEVPMNTMSKDVVAIEVSLDSLESGIDVPAFLIKKVIEGMDALPVTNFKESKRLIRLQEKLEKLLEV